MSAPIPRSPLPLRTTPTWEVELLISGVALFAMLQLPGWLDGRLLAMEPRLSSEWRVMVVLAYFYAKSAAVILAATFALHLLLRAQWIALVGIHSVHPQGVRLDRLRMGPIQRAVEGARNLPPDEAIERADNRASVVFALGVSVAVIMGAVCVVFCSALLIATLLVKAAGLPLDPLALVAWVPGLLLAPFLLAGLVDQVAGGRLAPTGRAYRMVAAVLRAYGRLGMGRLNSRVLATLSSNGRSRGITLLSTAIMLAAIGSVSVGYFALQNPAAMGSYGLFPEHAGERVDPMHYDDQRDPARGVALPYIDAMVASGPYLKLVVPYRPDRLHARMGDCRIVAAASQPRPAEARLACLQALHPVTLDGAAIPDPGYAVTHDPRTGRPALLAMLDIRGLAHGRHELVIGRPAREGRVRRAERDDPGHDRIVFWK